MLVGTIGSTGECESKCEITKHLFGPSFWHQLRLFLLRSASAWHAQARPYLELNRPETNLSQQDKTWTKFSTVNIERNNLTLKLKIRPKEL